MAGIKCMQNIDTENDRMFRRTVRQQTTMRDVHEGHYLPVCEQKQKHKHFVIQRLLCWHLPDKPSIWIILLLQRFPILVFSNMGPFKCYVTLFFCKLDPHPPPRNTNNIEHYLHYTFVMLFPGKSDTPHPHLRYVTLEWPLYLITVL